MEVESDMEMQLGTLLIINGLVLSKCKTLLKACQQKIGIDSYKQYILSAIQLGLGKLCSIIYGIIGYLEYFEHN